MESLKKRRSVIKANITRIEKTLRINELSPVVSAEASVLAYLGQVDEIRQKLNVLHDEITEKVDEDELDVHQLAFDELVLRVDTLQISLSAFKMAIDTSRTSSPAVASGISQSTAILAKIQLPKLDLPTFNGNPQDWISFHDLFTAMVHANKSLTNAQKLQYLKLSLKGEASNILQSVQVTDDNYQEAWTILTKRYQNLRQIVYSHLKRIIAKPVLMNESAGGLRKLVDNTMESVRALRVLKHPIEDNPWSVYLITEKLDHESRRQWALSLKDDQIPTFTVFFEFIDQRANALAEALSKTKQLSSDVKSGNSSQKFVKNTKSFHTAESKTVNYRIPRCNQCKGEHRIFSCETFRNSTLDDKWKIINQHNLCSNCLGAGHLKDNCKSQKKCTKCNGDHNSLLHCDRQPSLPSFQTYPSYPSTSAVKSSHARPNRNPEIKSHVGVTQGLLSTALIKIKDITGQQQYARVFLDGGSQASFITESLMSRLGLNRKHASFTVNGFGQTTTLRVNGKVNCTLFSRTETNFFLDVEAFIVPKVTGDLPNFQIDPCLFGAAIENLNLADPDFARPSKVELLIGAPVLLRIIKDGILLGTKGAPNAQNSHFGWLLSGEVNASQVGNRMATSAVNSLHIQMDSDSQLRKFWEIEEVKSKQPPMSKEDRECEAHFESTTTRDPEGSFIVKFPFKSNPELGDSRHTAMVRLQQMERKFNRQPELSQQYSAFMDEYCYLGHMTPVSPPLANQSKPIYYLPHHAVLKPNSTTTKLRVVFDASCKSSNGQSLNANLMVGPRLQEDLTNILLRFRTHKIAFTADIAKMYRQIQIHPDQRDFQRILYRKSPHEPIQEFQLNTVTYGTTSAPYQAVKCLHTIASADAVNFPQASKVLKTDFYMDDLMSGESSSEKSLTLMNQVRELCSKGKFLLRKFASNDQTLLDSLADDLKETRDLHIEFDESVGTLGLRWHPASDTFSFTMNFPVLKDGIVTKRSLLSDVARIFDPLGWLAPVVISCKILFQQLWKENLDWGEPLPEIIRAKWLCLRDNFPNIRELSIPRWLHTSGLVPQCDLHGFSDASQLAYSAVVYLVTTDSDGQSRATLITCKTKVAPIKTISLPRLELCGAVLLARLIGNVKRALRFPINGTVGWTDSTIVLAWLNDRPDRWKIFVANRTSEILDTIPYSCWRHVPSEDNPADCASRGISPSELQRHPLWWHGPAWLVQDSIYWPSFHTPKPTLEEGRNPKVMTTNIEMKVDIFSLFSSYLKLKRAVAYWLRFISNVKIPKPNRKFGSLTALELHNSQNRLILLMQRDEFQDELKFISSKQELRKGNRIKPLNPFLDKDGILRVGGRLTAAPIPNNQKYPVLLPQKHPLTKLIIRDQHIRNLHAGPRLLLNTLQQQFWILGGMNAIRRVTHRCLDCIRQQAKSAQQYMGDLPKARTELIQPFFRTGVDYAGPVILRHGGRRSKQFSKCYISFFICMATKAIHLELVSDLTSEAFIAALKRFIARRGRCSEIFSDNGTNFVGANRELKDLHELVTSITHNDVITKFLANESITWRFNPPSAPHQGGLWEAAVKSAKYHLKRVIGSSIYNMEEYMTLLCQIEACLNSRPLCALSNSPDEPEVLTPGHFLIGKPLNTIPEPNITHLHENRLDYWQKIQQRVQNFWSRWQAEYLATLQKRTKWTSHHPNVKIGDIVIVKEENSGPTRWPLGIIKETFPGKDGKVREVLLKCTNGSFRRPIVKLCLIPND